MLKQCISCNKNIGLLTVRIPLLENDNIVICDDCFQKMPEILNDIYLKRVFPCKSDLIVIKENVMNELATMDYNNDTLNVIAKFLDNKIEKAPNAANNDGALVQKICPVCNRKLSYESKICSECGFDFDNQQLSFSNSEIAKVYNRRIEQIKNNPFYEYDFVVIPNNHDGSVDKEKILKIIKEHSLQGWRIVTMYSNEIGKNSIVGVNATACEDIILFERCIKL